MDRGAGRIAQDLKDIAKTREAMAHKLDLLEQRLQDTVQATKSMVSDVVEKIQETTEDVRDKAEEYVQNTKRALNPSYQIQERPWLMLGGAILVGYALGRLEAGRLIDVASEQLSASESWRRSSGQRGAVPWRDPNIREEMVKQVQEQVQRVQGTIIEAGRLSCTMWSHGRW